MPSIFSHAVAALAVGKVSSPQKMPARFWVLTALCAMLPDVDVLSFSFGVERSSIFSHRGLTHSLFFALVLALLVVSLAFRERKAFTRRWWLLVLYFFVVTASHGLLDMLTNGGSGVALFAPFDATRHRFPWTPIEVSPIGMRFFSERGLEVFESEFVWVWIPAIVLAAGAWVYRKTFRTKP
jgi:inner membrane protein